MGERGEGEPGATPQKTSAAALPLPGYPSAAAQSRLGREAHLPACVTMPPHGVPCVLQPRALHGISGFGWEMVSAASRR
eukprot:10591348-Heterocapsa_arctica.AAC.1